MRQGVNGWGMTKLVEFALSQPQACFEAFTFGKTPLDIIFWELCLTKKIYTHLWSAQLPMPSNRPLQGTTVHQLSVIELLALQVRMESMGQQIRVK